MILTPPREATLASAPSSDAASQARTAPPDAANAVAQRVGLRALAVAGEPVGLNGSFDRFGVEAQTKVVAANDRGETAFYSTIRRSQAEEGMFLARADG